MAAKKKTINRVDARDKAKQYDAQYMGDEPTWEGVEFIDDSARRSAKIDAFNWYNYFKPEVADYRNEVKAWLRANEKLSAGEAEKVARAWSNVQAAKLCAMANNGWEMSESEFNLVQAAYFAATFIPDEPTPGERLITAAKEASAIAKKGPKRPKMMEALEELEDQWVEGQPGSLSLTIRQTQYKDSKISLETFARPWLEGRLAEYTTNWDKEGYPHLTVKAKNARVKLLQTLIKELDDLTATKKGVRKKKAPTKAQQAKKFVCLSASPEFGVKSIPVKDIIGAQRVFLFNDKYRTLTELVAKDDTGFGGKGMEITNVDESKSRATKLRKPLDVLPKVCKNALRTIHKAWDGLTTKDVKANPRLNRNTVILRVL
jgi:hypothetical protein